MWTEIWKKKFKWYATIFYGTEFKNKLTFGQNIFPFPPRQRHHLYFLQFLAAARGLDKKNVPVNLSFTSAFLYEAFVLVNYLCKY